jgi:hypothetical protein
MRINPARAVMLDTSAIAVMIIVGHHHQPGTLAEARGGNQAYRLVVSSLVRRRIMPSPKSTIHQLEKKLNDHPPHTPEQKEISKVLRHPKFQDALEELDQDPHKRNQAAANPAGHLQAKGVPLPSDMTVELVPNNWSFSCCLWGVCGGYNSSGGWWISW